MADILGTGLSGLRALQRALDTTSHNIANVSTEGYTRQRVEFQTRPAAGVRRRLDRQRRRNLDRAPRLRSVPRAADPQPAAPTSRGSTRSLRRRRASTTCSAMRPMDCRARCRGSPTPSTKFPARRHRFRRARCCSPKDAHWPSASRLTTRACATCRPRSTAGSASKRRKSPTLAQGVARLNGEIAAAIQQSGQPPNDLLDQRDALIDQLSGKVSVTVVAEGDATLNVFIGNGQPLVLGNQASQITTTVGSARSGANTLLSMRTGAGTMDISRVVSGGTLGGLLDWRSEMLDPARNELGRIGVAIATQVNAQHREGMDLTGALGGNFFNIGAATATAATANTGTSVVTVTRTNLGALTGQRLRSRAHRARATRCAARIRAPPSASPAPAPARIRSSPTACPSSWARASRPATSS